MVPALAFFVNPQFDGRSYTVAGGKSHVDVPPVAVFAADRSGCCVSGSAVFAGEESCRGSVYDSGQVNASGSADLLSPNLKPDLNPPKPLDRIRAGEYHPRLNQFGLPHVLVLGPDGLSQDDTLCYAIRSYKVARDDPQSDSTHPAGYSTCQPATRFHVHTTEERVLAPTP